MLGYLYLFASIFVRIDFVTVEVFSDTEINLVNELNQVNMFIYTYM